MGFCKKKNQYSNIITNDIWMIFKKKKSEVADGYVERITKVR